MMDFSSQSLLYLAMLLTAPVLVVVAINLVFHPQGGMAKGFGGSLLIGMCWIATMVLILQKVRH